MNRLICVIALLLFARTAATYGQYGQSNQVFLEKRSDGWWATWSNTPAMFKISTSTNLVNWEVWMRKESGGRLKSMEMKLVNSNDYNFMKFEPIIPYYPPPISTNLNKLVSGLTNQLQTESIKRKSRK